MFEGLREGSELVRELAAIGTVGKVMHSRSCIRASLRLDTYIIEPMSMNHRFQLELSEGARQGA